jgi:hypothetical protein
LRIDEHNRASLIAFPTPAQTRPCDETEPGLNRYAARLTLARRTYSHSSSPPPARLPLISRRSPLHSSASALGPSDTISPGLSRHRSDGWRCSCCLTRRTPPSIVNAISAPKSIFLSRDKQIWSRARFNSRPRDLS